MALSEAAIQELLKKGEYLKVIETYAEWERENPGTPAGMHKLCAGWAYHQLGRYKISVLIMETLRELYPADSEIGDSARRGLAHGLFQLERDEKARQILAELHPSLNRDNVRANEILKDAKAGRSVPVAEIRRMLTEAIWTVPHQVVNGHIINNLTFALHEARGQREVKPFCWILPGLIEMAMAIYKETGAAKNHQAGVLYRAASIFLEVPGWEKPALGLIDQCIALWMELVAVQDGDRYAQNLTGAQRLREQILARIGS